MGTGAQANPHIRDDYSPLSAIIMQVIRRDGEFHPSTIDAELAYMFLEFANEIVDDVLTHPYHTGEAIDYYTAIDEARPIEDTILHAGLHARYATQQGKGSMQYLVPMYARKLNQRLWHKLNGNTPIQMHIPDGGTNRANVAGRTTSLTSGLTSDSGTRPFTRKA